MIRIANGQGFWGDWLEAPVRLVDGGPIDYLTLDYLAGVTMSILQKQRSRNPPDKPVILRMLWIAICAGVDKAGCLDEILISVSEIRPLPGSAHARPRPALRVHPMHRSSKSAASIGGRA